jgi:hypothetical protein
MTKRAFGLFLTIVGAGAFGAGCSSSSSNNGTGGTTGAGGKVDAGSLGGAAGAGIGGAGVGGAAGARVDAGLDAVADAAADAPADAPTDAAVTPTFTMVFNQVLNNVATPTPDTSPGCANCHDGVSVDGGPAGLVISHSINYRDKAAAYIALVGTAIPAVGVDSLRCPAADGGAAVKRVLPGNPAESVLVQKLRQGLGMGVACDNVGMPLNPNVPADAGPDAGADGGFTMTHHAITQAQLDLIVAWVTAGALNN